MELFDYVTLKLIVWGLVGFFLIAFALTDGFDLGIGAISLWVAPTDEDRRQLLNIVGPFWEGQQVWFIMGGTLLFAAWPLAYATSFSAFYWVLFLLLWTLFLRPACIDYRSKMPSPRWRANWDRLLWVATVVPAVVFGAAFGNLLLGVEFHFNNFMQSFYTGTLLQQFHPFALLCGFVSLFMLIMHGGYYLYMRADEHIGLRGRRFANIAALTYVVFFVIGGYFIAYKIEGYQVVSLAGATHDILTPLGKTVHREVGAWMGNYDLYPWMRVLPCTAIVSALASIIFSRLSWTMLPFFCSGLAIACTIMTAGASLFPFIFPSAAMPDHSLTIWDAVASPTSLGTIVVITLGVLPIIMIYVTWVYRKLSGKVAEKIY